MSDDDWRKKSIERARTTAERLVGTGLDALLPGSGPILTRLGKHVVGLVVDERMSRLEDFHRRVFEGDVGDHEINERFRAMEDGDFQHLLAAMLSDIEREKVPIYSAVYIYLVDRAARDGLDKDDKVALVLAVSQLHRGDFFVIRESRAEGGIVRIVDPDRPAHTGRIQRLLTQGVLSRGDGMHTLGAEEALEVTNLGHLILEVVERALDEEP